MAGRAQQVSVNGALYTKFNLCCGVFQGRCLDPLLLTIYMSTLLDILKSHLPTVHTYVDDTQRYLLFNSARGSVAISDSTNEAQAVAAIETVFMMLVHGCGIIS